MPALCAFLESDNRAIYAMEHRPGTRGLLTKQRDDARDVLQWLCTIPQLLKLLITQWSLLRCCYNLH